MTALLQAPAWRGTFGVRGATFRASDANFWLLAHQGLSNPWYAFDNWDVRRKNDHLLVDIKMSIRVLRDDTPCT